MEEWLRKNRTIVLFAILALAAFFRFYQITTIPPGLFSDEAVNGINTLEANDTGNYKVFYPENNGREGLFINIQALSVQIFGNKPWALRGVSAMFGIFTILGLYLLTKGLFKKESVALFASFFLATSYWHINFSRIGFRAIMAPFFLVWGLWLLWRLIPKEDHKDEFPDSLAQRLHSQQHVELHRKKIISSAALFFAGLIFGFGFHSYIAYRVMPILLIPAFIILLKDKYFKEILIFLLGIFIAVMPLAVYFYVHPSEFLGRTSQVSVFTSPTPLFDLGKNVVLTIGMFFVAGDFNWRHNFAGAPELWWPVAALFLIGLVISFKKFLVPRYALLVLWIILALAPVMISNEGIPHALRAIIVIPAVMIFAALGLDAVLQKIPQKAAVLVIILFTLVSLQTFNQYFIKWANNPNVPSAFSKDAADTANYLNSLPKETPKYVIMESENQNMPMSVNTVMFLTDTYLEKYQKEKNIKYIFKKDEGLVPSGVIKVWIK
ncbi:MAG: glycosyltransferase family 39 protein [Candidatus Paceibacterota bacterium]